MGNSEKLYYTCIIVAQVSLIPIILLGACAFISENIIFGIGAAVGLVAELIEAGLMDELLRDRGIPR